MKGALKGEPKLKFPAPVHIGGEVETVMSSPTPVSVPVAPTDPAIPSGGN